MQRFVIFAIILGAIFPLSSCRKPLPEDRVIAAINGEQVFESEFTLFQKSSRLKPGAGAPEGISNPALLNKFIERKIVLSEAKKLNITVTASETASALQAYELELSGGGFAELLKRQGISPEGWNKYAVEELVFEKTVSCFGGEVKTGDDEIKAYYRAHLKEFSRGEQAHAYQIVSDNAAAAENIRKELEGGADFETMAKTRSIAPDKENGGDLGFVSAEDLPAEMSVAVFKTETGKLSPVTKSDYGFHVFFVKEKRKKGTAGIDEVRPVIEERLRRAKAEKALASRMKELGSSTNVKMNKAYLEELK